MLTVSGCFYNHVINHDHAIKTHESGEEAVGQTRSEQTGVGQTEQYR